MMPSVLIHAVKGDLQVDDDGDYYLTVVAQDIDEIHENMVLYAHPEILYHIIRHCKAKFEPYIMEIH